MGTQVAAIHGGTSLAVQSESELIAVLRNSLYPGAKDESIKLVMSYCKAAGLDPFKKPVHIVPMSVKTGKKKPNSQYDETEMRDVIMPGIGLYRTDAARSGQYAGVTDPEFGPEITTKLNGVTITYPQWCRVTVKRLMSHGVIVEFSAKEFWLENYATAGRDRPEPNAMWKKRPFAQLAKCCEAQALRKAFPEVGSAPTADEMEGREIEINPLPETNTAATPPADEKKGLPTYPEANFDKNLPAWQKLISEGKSPDDIIKSVQSRYVMTDEQKEQIRAATKREPVAIDGQPMTEDEIAEAEAKQLAREGNE